MFAVVIAMAFGAVVPSPKRPGLGSWSVALHAGVPVGNQHVGVQRGVLGLGVALGALHRAVGRMVEFGVLKPHRRNLRWRDAHLGRQGGLDRLGNALALKVMAFGTQALAEVQILFGI